MNHVRSQSGASMCGSPTINFDTPTKSMQNIKEKLVDLLAKEMCNMLPHPCVPPVVPHIGCSVLETMIFQGRIACSRCSSAFERIKP